MTQEVLVKVITRLSTFRGESAFRTRLYRIVVNHVINLKKKRPLDRRAKHDADPLAESYPKKRWSIPFRNASSPA